MSKGLERSRQLLKEVFELKIAIYRELNKVLKDKNLYEIKEVLSEFESSELEILCQLAIPQEDYEICQVVQELISDRSRISN